MEESQIRTKRLNDMSREELITIAEEGGIEKQKLLERLSQMIEAQKTQLEGMDPNIMEKVVAERDLLKKKALELISRGKAAQAKLAEQAVEIEDYQSRLQESESRNHSLQEELTSLKFGMLLKMT